MEENVNGKTSQSTQLFSIDKPKPSNIEAEVAVLGSMFIKPEAVSTALSALRFDNAFYRPAHQLIFDAIMELNMGKNDAAVDPIVLADHLERSGKLEAIGGRAYIMQLMDAVPTAAAEYADVQRRRDSERKTIQRGKDPCAGAGK